MVLTSVGHVLAWYAFEINSITPDTSIDLIGRKLSMPSTNFLHLALMRARKMALECRDVLAIWAN